MTKIAVFGKVNKDIIKNRYESRKETIVFEPDVEDFLQVSEYGAAFFLNCSDAEIALWVGNEHLRLAKTEAELFAEIDFFFGIPEPLEIERKFLVEKPDFEALEAMPLCKAVEIQQAYTKDENGDNMRLRKRGADGSFVYIKTQKIRISDTTRIELESRVSEQEFEAGVKGCPVLSKTRYLFVSGGKYFELDAFPFWNEAILEIELKSADEEFGFPPFLKVIREVTAEKQYRNSVIAAEHGIVRN